MTNTNPVIHETTIRVRYPESDPMGYAHHSAFPVWLEIARSELIRESGITYRQLEKEGYILPVVELQIKYISPLHYDDELLIISHLVQLSLAKIIFRYDMYCNKIRVAKAHTTLACVTREGTIQQMPKILFNTFGKRREI